MAKDPAFLFYYQDFLVGTEFMSNDEVGQYIRILCHLADKDALTEKQVLSICRASAIQVLLREKLEVDADGRFFNSRLRTEMEKRRKFSDSRRKNALGEKAYAEHMENENEDVNEDVVVQEKEKKKIEHVVFKDGKLSIGSELFEEFCSEFGRDALAKELPKMEAWLKFNKPKKDYKRFIFNWLNRSRQDGNGRNVSQQSGYRKAGAGGETTEADLRSSYERGLKLLEEDRRRSGKTG